MSDDHVPGLLHPTRTALLVIDMQARFAPVIPEFHELAETCSRLCRTFRMLELPVFATEQYPQGLGVTVPVVRREIEMRDIPDKTTFSSYRHQEIRDSLGAAGASSVLVCGIEAHVCVLQTVHDLLAADFEVHVVVDAIASRVPAVRDLAVRRMEMAGTILNSAETAVYELLRDAKHPLFRSVQEIFG